MAAFADVGTVFNRNKGSIQQINNKDFLPDQPFLQTTGVSSIGNALLLKNATNDSFFTQDFSGGFFVYTPTGLTLPGVTGNPVAGDPITKNTYLSLFQTNCPLVAEVRTCSQAFTDGFRSVFLRGDAQTNTLVRVSDSQFSGFKNFASSVGLELRVQVPIVNVPFRLIYYINPSVREIDYGTFQLPLSKRNGFRFTVGRTF